MNSIINKLPLEGCILEIIYATGYPRSKQNNVEIAAIINERVNILRYCFEHNL